MKVRLDQVFAVVIIGSVLFAVVPSLLEPIPEEATVEDTSHSQTAETLSVIVSATDAAAAARAIEEVGGQVVGELGLTNTVTAAITAEQLNALVAHPDVLSILNNSRVKSVLEPEPNDQGG